MGKAVVVGAGKDRDKGVVVRAVLVQHRVRAMLQAALMVSLQLAHLHRTVPVDTVVKQCIRQDLELAVCPAINRPRPG
ncbi:hypothetical protein NTGM5_260022 [Candidatus Nitrotoga sp. M5]|nr:hypothetical protein NTGM5_260022 [Candidatus Nitrotoga sp. M5]